MPPLARCGVGGEFTRHDLRRYDTKAQCRYFVPPHPTAEAKESLPVFYLPTVVHFSEKSAASGRGEESRRRVSYFDLLLLRLEQCPVSTLLLESLQYLYWEMRHGIKNGILLPYPTQNAPLSCVLSQTGVLL